VRRVRTPRDLPGVPGDVHGRARRDVDRDVLGLDRREELAVEEAAIQRHRAERRVSFDVLLGLPQRGQRADDAVEQRREPVQ